MARGATIARAGAHTTASPSPSLRDFAVVPFGSSGESFNWNGSQAGSEDTVPTRARWWTNKAKAWSESIEGISESTRRMYFEKALTAYAALRRLGYDPTPRSVNRQMVEALLRDESMAPTTRTTYAFCLHGLLAHIGNPLADASHKRLWKPPRWIATRRRWASLDETCALLNAAPDEAARVAIALLGCGLRQDEVVRLRVLDLEKGPTGWGARVRGKGGKPRAAALTDQAVDALIPVVHRKPPEALVYGWKRSRLWRDVARACRIAGLRHLSPHDIRRGFARSYLRVAVESGMNYPDALGSLQELLGHEDAAQTLYYAQPEREAAVRGVSALSLAYASAESRGA